jgi:mono/diheme cytochrome c family protein
MNRKVQEVTTLSRAVGKHNVVRRSSTITPAAATTERGIRVLAAFLVSVLYLMGSVLLSSLTWAGPSESVGKGPRPAAAEQGRAIFNGKGICSSCHGIDGYRDRLPEHLTQNARTSIAGLDPKPTDLRNPAGLTLTTDKQRFDAIRHGRLRTAMHPLPTEALSDEDILSLLAYLASIRGKEVLSSAAREPAGVPEGDVESGRRLYHEIGGCFVCHGVEGHLHRKPNMSAELREKLSRLQPPPANLRNPRSLKAENDHDRFRSIKYGHPGTAMFPKNLLRDDDIWDLIAYLDTLRGDRR